MNVEATALPGVLLLSPRVFADDRGHFLETWRRDRYAALGIDGDFAQDNASFSRRGVLRGLHFQQPHGQGKLVSVLLGEVWDVAVDVRAGSPTFGQWVGYTLSAGNARQLWIPAGYAHGFVVTSDEAVFSYKCTDVYHPEAELTVRWDDPDVAVAWPVQPSLVADKDAAAPFLRDIPPERLPRYAGPR
jgi:dTDP-4-dehydrorhamnose 3,5-epimerase